MVVFFIQRGSQVCHESALTFTDFLTSNKCSIYLKDTCPGPTTIKHLSVCVCPYWPSWAPVGQNVSSITVKLKADLKEYQSNTVRHYFMFHFNISKSRYSFFIFSMKSKDTVSLATLELNWFFFPFIFVFLHLLRLVKCAQYNPKV